MSNYYVSNPDESKEFLPRYRIFYAALTFAVVVFTLRLLYLQVFEGDQLREFSEKNRIKQVKIAAPRGLIYDRDGTILVENHPGFEMTLNPQYIKDLDTLAQKIGPLISMDAQQIIAKVKRSRRQNGPFASVKIKDDLTREELFRLKRVRIDTPGLDIRETVLRHYPLGANGAQLLGYVAEISKRQIPTYNELYKGKYTFEQGDLIGKSGLEEVLELDLRGKDGTQLLQVDAFGRETGNESQMIYGDEIRDRDPEQGLNAVLTIDKTVQEAAYKSFEENKRIGALIAMKTNGEILAWVSAPSYDPNVFARGVSSQVWSQLVNDPFKPLRNKVVQDHFSPGSTFKAFMAVAALQEKVVTPQTVIYCPGSFYFGKRQYHDHLRGGHGNITIFEALERSSNVFFYKMGIALGIDKMYNYIAPFGLGSKTDVELKNREIAGLMPSAAWKKKNLGEEWQPGENLSVAIGQGFVQASPIQMAVGYNAIGTEGKVVKPFVIRKVMDDNGKVIRENNPVLVRDLTQEQSTGIHVSPQTFKIVKEGLKKVANGSRGTAAWLKVPGVQMAGKTGTSQVMGFSADQIYAKCENRPIHQRHHGWYIAFAPADNPEITVAAIAEHSCHGSTGAGPMVRDTMRAYFEKYHPDIIAEALKNKKQAVRVEEVPIPAPVEGE